MAADLVSIDSIRQAHCSTHSARATGDGQPLHVISALGRRLRLCSTSSWHGSIPWARSRPLSQPTKGFQHGSELDAQWSCSSSRLGHVVELHEQSKQYGTIRRHGLWPPVEQQSARFAIYVKKNSFDLKRLPFQNASVHTSASLKLATVQTITYLLATLVSRTPAQTTLIRKSPAYRAKLAQHLDNQL